MLSSPCSHSLTHRPFLLPSLSRIRVSNRPGTLCPNTRTLRSFQSHSNLSKNVSNCKVVVFLNKFTYPSVYFFNICLGFGELKSLLAFSSVWLLRKYWKREKKMLNFKYSQRLEDGLVEYRFGYCFKFW
jgi:hypothetical protein